MLCKVFTVFTKHKQARNITKLQWKDIRILPANSIHTIRRKFVSNRIYEVACLVQVAINVLKYSPCCYIVLTVTLTFSTFSSRFFIDFLCPKGCSVLKKYRDGKGLWRSCQKKRMEEEKAWDDAWKRVAEFPRTFLFPQVRTLVLSLYCHHVSESVNCSTSFKLLCITLGWTSIWYWYYNSWHCSTTLVMLSGCHGSKEVIHCTRGRK